MASQAHGGPGGGHGLSPPHGTEWAMADTRIRVLQCALIILDCRVGGYAVRWWYQPLRFLSCFAGSSLFIMGRWGRGRGFLIFIAGNGHDDLLQ